uniref:Uncharacterized protein n=1 Tax=Hyaloperonospora arabidopsidis (strain Emoy2) TaxID=559515 RepID=M4B9U5_HYAAE
MGIFRISLRRVSDALSYVAHVSSLNHQLSEAIDEIPKVLALLLGETPKLVTELD